MDKEVRGLFLLFGFAIGLIGMGMIASDVMKTYREVHGKCPEVKCVVAP
jgi:phosphoglycerate dehydrogenase-like enzyme